MTLESERLQRFLFQWLGEGSAEEIKSSTARAVDVFIAVYGPRPVKTPEPDSGGYEKSQ
ncbi:MAG: hypothetical protein WBP72_03820 [Rhodocyclaceae bacterium]